MILFLGGLVLLVVGYFTYGAAVALVFAAYALRVTRRHETGRG